MAGSDVAALAAYLTATEAKCVADRLENGDSLTAAMAAVGAVRRKEAAALFGQSGLGLHDVPGAIAVLRAVEGAKSAPALAMPVWTLPGNLSKAGHLTSQVAQLVRGARESVTCATYNFAPRSALWDAFAEFSSRPGTHLRLYVDTAAADGKSSFGGFSVPSTSEIAAQLPAATVLRTKKREGKLVRSHAKFLAIDHRTLVVTSANFSKSAELLNVEFGLVMDDSILTANVEKQMSFVEGDLYEVVTGDSWCGDSIGRWV